MKRVVANIALMLAVTLVCLGLAEAGLRALTQFPVHGKKANKVYDRDLGYRLNHFHPTIDANGFRNREPGKKEVAAIGDSHTYGSGVEYEEAWPVVFETLTGAKTYNFGVGSYASYTYYALGMHAAREGFRDVIIALNIHNDFTIEGTSCAIDYKSSPFWQDAKARLDLHLPECRLEDTWQTADAPDIVRRYRGKVNFAILSAWDVLVAEPLEAWWHDVTFTAPGKPAKETKKASAAPARPTPVAEGDIRASSWYFNRRGVGILEQARHTSDDTHPVTRYVVEDFEKMMRDLARTLEEKGARLGVLLLPSKLKLVYETASNRDIYEQKPWLKQLAEHQVALEARLTAFMGENAIAWKSAQPELAEQARKAAAGGTRVYKPNGNHPYPEGFRLYAVAAAKLYETMRQGR